MRRWTGALGILISALFVISLSVTSHLIVTGLGAAGEVAALGAPEPFLGASEVTQEVAPLGGGVEWRPTDDTNICAAYPDNVQKNKETGVGDGTRYNMYVGYEADPYPGIPIGDNTRIYLRFDLSDIDVDIDNAFLLLYDKHRPSTGSEPYPPRDLWLRAHRVDNDDWQEGMLTWNKAQENHPCGDNVTPTLHLTSEGIWVGWEVTSYVEEQLADDKIVSFCIKNNVEADDNTVWFYTKDADEHQVHLDIGMRIRKVSVTTYRPKYRVGMPGGTLYFKDIFVKNIGSESDDYDLSVSDNTGWGAGNLGVSPSTVYSLSPGENRLVTAWATIPPGTAAGTVNNITVTATSQEDENVRDNDSWEARVAADRLGPTEDDSWVTDNAPDNNYSDDTWMRVESFSGDARNSRMFLKHDLSGLQPENNIASAEL